MLHAKAADVRPVLVAAPRDKRVWRPTGMNALAVVGLVGRILAVFAAVSYTHLDVYKRQGWTDRVLILV